MEKLLCETEKILQRKIGKSMHRGKGLVGVLLCVNTSHENYYQSARENKKGDGKINKLNELEN